jgi:conjugative relaxase-like TrwC/TraI family protein
MPKTGEDQAAAEAAALARYRQEHPFASASEINAERTRIRAISPGIARPYYDVTSSASKSVSVLHASLRVAAGQAREAGDQVQAAALDGEAQAIEDALRDSVREGLELLEAMACYVRTGHHSATTGEWRDGKGLVATSWLHTSSRDGDPQLHIHLAVLNAVQRADGADDTWRAADGQHFYQLRHLYGVTVDRAFEQRLLAMGYAMTGRADGNGAEIGGVSQQVMDRFTSRARAIDGRLRTWVDQYTARHGKPPSRRTIYLMGQEIAKDTRRPKAEAKRMAGGKVTGHLVSDDERLKAWEDQTTADELQVLSTVYAEATAYAARSPARRELAHADKARAARIAVAEAQRQRSVWGISDLCLEAHRALPVGATPADCVYAGSLTPYGRIPNPVLFALDEVTQTAAVPLADWLATSAGSGIQVCFIVHTPAQLRVRYGADTAKAIWALAGTKIVLGGNTDADMAEEISTLAGMYGGEMALPVVPVAYIRQLPESRALVLAMNRSPIAVKVRPVWRRTSFRLRINPAAYLPLPEPVPLPPALPEAEGEAA